jgi:hypothetical protein
MKIMIETIPHESQRYPTCGDWLFDTEGNLNIYVSEMGCEESEVAVGVHEMREALSCRRDGIKEEDVSAFDIQFEKERAVGKHSVEAEPGNDERAPYYKQHQTATFAERAFLDHITWEEHESNIPLD